MSRTSVYLLYTSTKVQLLTRKVQILMQVMFIRLDLDLENTSLDVVHMTHKACLAIQVRALLALLGTTGAQIYLLY